MVTQWVPLDASNPAVRVTVYFKADDLRVEYQQTSAGAKMELTFYDDNGEMIGSPISKAARLGTYDWEPVIIRTDIPPNSTSYESVFYECTIGKTVG